MYNVQYSGARQVGHKEGRLKARWWCGGPFEVGMNPIYPFSPLMSSNQTAEGSEYSNAKKRRNQVFAEAAGSFLKSGEVETVCERVIG